MAPRSSNSTAKKPAAAPVVAPWPLVAMLLGGFVIGFGVRTWLPPPSAGPFPATPPSAAERRAPNPAARAMTAKDIVPVGADDHLRGPENASITVIEYSDFECPFCKRFHPTMAALLKNDPDVQWVYRHFPLPMHANAQKAAEASECVADLAGNDAFWKMTDALFALQSITEDAMVNAAMASGASEQAFRDCLTDGRMAARVTASRDGGAKAGVTGTPGSIVIHNPSGRNELVRGAKQLPALQAVIENLRTGKASPAAAAPPRPPLETIAVTIENGVFSPASVSLKRNALAVLALTAKGASASVAIPPLKLKADIPAGTSKRLRVKTGTVGTFVDVSGAFTVVVTP